MELSLLEYFIDVHSAHSLADDCPLVSDLVVQFDESLLQDRVPLLFSIETVDMCEISASNKKYRSRHCLPDLPVIPCSTSIFRAMWLHLVSPLVSNTCFKTLSYSSDHDLLSAMFRLGVVYR